MTTTTKTAPAKPKAQATEPRYEPIGPAAQDGVSEIDQSIFVPDERFPLIMRFSGDKKVFDATVAAGKAEQDPALKKALSNQAKTSFGVTGYYFIPLEKYAEATDQTVDMIPEDFAPKGWQRYTVNFGEKETPGFATRDITIAVIRMRRIREIKREHKDSGLPKKWGWFMKMSEVQKGKYQTRLQILCIVKGMEELGAATLTMKTMAVTAMLGNRRFGEPAIFNPMDSGEGADSYFYKYVLGPANIEYKQKVNPRGAVPQNWYWLELTNAKDAGGFPQWNKVEYGEGPNDFIYVCPPAWARYQQVLDKKFDFHTLYVGDEIARIGDNIRRTKSDEWVAKWNNENISALNLVVSNADVADEVTDPDEAFARNNGKRVAAPPPPEADFGEGYVQEPPSGEPDVPF